MTGLAGELVLLGAGLAYAGSIVYTLVGRAVWRHISKGRKPLQYYHWGCDPDHTTFSGYTCYMCRKARARYNRPKWLAILWPLTCATYSVVLSVRWVWRALSAPHRMILSAPCESPEVGSTRSTELTVETRAPKERHECPHCHYKYREPLRVGGYCSVSCLNGGYYMKRA